jgi:hypothetical protein
MNAREYYAALKAIQFLEEEEIPSEEARHRAAGMNPEQVEVMVAPMKAKVVQMRTRVTQYERTRGRRD